MTKKLIGAIVGIAFVTLTFPADVRATSTKPNILFVIMDDVGIDQLSLFGYGGDGVGPLAPARTPVLAAISAGGVRFRNTWAPPECSPSRANFFTGRYAFRHGVMAALLPPDLANSQLSPFETTIPKVLKTAGYKSALIGKAHLTNSPTNPQTPSTDPYQGTAVTQLGWDYFKGWYDGGPNGIDTTAGGVGVTDQYQCGYVPSTAIGGANGANFGACFKTDGTCSDVESSGIVGAGLSCLASGGILRPNTTCNAASPSGLNFNKQNAYYVGEVVEITAPGNNAVVKSASDPASRGYRTTLEADFAIDWINRQSTNTPWMTTLSFASGHTPYQPAPLSLIYSASTAVGNTCSDDTTDSRILMTQMIEAMDKELGRVLVETGVATRNTDGSIKYNPASNTVVVVVGDNGSFAGNVRLPFDPAHSKGTVYQTGVWVPLIVAGPMVVSPNRDVESMINTVDLFKLFGDLAGVDVRSVVPSTHGLDAQAMLPYLLNTRQDNTPIRSTNFTQYDENIRSTSFVYGTCVVQSANTCTTLFPAPSPCTENGGIWYGKGSEYNGGAGYSSCCQVNQYLASMKQPVAAVLPDVAYAIRNKDYKLIRQTSTNYNPQNPGIGQACLTSTTDEFYKIDEARRRPALDRPDGALRNNLLPDGTGPGGGTSLLNGIKKRNYIDLANSLNELLNSQKDCPGDANLDGVIDTRDLNNQAKWKKITNGASTWWDMNTDGYTNKTDTVQLKRSSCRLLPGQSR